MINEISIRTHSHTDIIDITQYVQNVVASANIKEGTCIIYVPHTTCGIFINEDADPSVVQDIENTLERLVPWQAHYSHIEGNSAAHIKSVLVGTHQIVIIENNHLLLGTWQGIFLAEFDGPRTRRVIVKIISDKI
ncbi:MAG TPA: secondary thiamine-phosphate synthase enzyme YjbQ, partial [Bacteroidota bacterium]|nr:secondary thiamine-phosphate synthase enzyme YjbQ [Candidatus Kapabacteria bacterium]HRS02477.1 secondary thiamine-phosphate synthase enzyme YjbQ [Bacteroidota bacterium]HRT68097.1 secondary thiamine-phosphate synthase enzyme YjbQ [Bacteroidota bacterium]